VRIFIAIRRRRAPSSDSLQKRRRGQAVTEFAPAPSALHRRRNTVVPWLVAGAVAVVVIVGAAIVFRVVLMRADTDTDNDADEDDSDVDEADAADGRWSSPARPR